MCIVRIMMMMMHAVCACEPVLILSMLCANVHVHVRALRAIALALALALAPYAGRPVSHSNPSIVPAIPRILSIISLNPGSRRSATAGMGLEGYSWTNHGSDDGRPLVLPAESEEGGESLVMVRWRVRLEWGMGRWNMIPERLYSCEKLPSVVEPPSLY